MIQTVFSFRLASFVLIAAVPLACAGCSSTSEITGTQSAATGLSAGLSNFSVPSITGALGGISMAEPPVAAYTKLARIMNNCWLHGSQPLLKNIRFYAKVSKGKNEKASISLFERPPNKKRGILAYDIEITPTSSGSAIFVDNHRIEDATAERMKQDLTRWGQGDLDCSSVASNAWAADLKKVSKQKPKRSRRKKK